MWLWESPLNSWSQFSCVLEGSDDIRCLVVFRRAINTVLAVIVIVLKQMHHFLIFVWIFFPLKAWVWGVDNGMKERLICFSLFNSMKFSGEKNKARIPRSLWVPESSSHHARSVQKYSNHLICRCSVYKHNFSKRRASLLCMYLKTNMGLTFTKAISPKNPMHQINKTTVVNRRPAIWEQERQTL